MDRFLHSLTYFDGTSSKLIYIPNRQSLKIQVGSGIARETDSLDPTLVHEDKGEHLLGPWDSIFIQNLNLFSVTILCAF